MSGAECEGWKSSRALVVVIFVVWERNVFRKQNANKAGDFTYWKCATAECPVKVTVKEMREVVRAAGDHTHVEVNVDAKKFKRKLVDDAESLEML
jgi:hypothetical protein